MSDILPLIRPLALLNPVLRGAIHAHVVGPVGVEPTTRGITSQGCGGRERSEFWAASQGSLGESERVSWGWFKRTVAKVWPQSAAGPAV
jgi:hypothetical protein